MPPPVRPTVAPGKGGQSAETHIVHLAAGPVTVPVYDRATLGAGDRLEGPAIVTQLDATTLVRPDWIATVQPNGAMVLTLAEQKV